MVVGKELGVPDPFSTSVGCHDAADYCFDHYVALGLEHGARACPCRL